MDNSILVFADNIKRHRKLNNLTLERLALMCGTSKSTIHGIENNTHEPKLGIALKIADALDLKLDNITSR